jgi:hypothetical protein
LDTTEDAWEYGSDKLAESDGDEVTSIPSIKHECRAAGRAHDSIEHFAMDMVEGAEHPHGRVLLIPLVCSNREQKYFDEAQIKELRRVD